MLNVKNVIESATKMLGIDELGDLSSTSSLDDRAQKILNDLIYCFNEVYQELLTDYFPIVIEEEMTLDKTRRVVFENLNNHILRLYAILDENYQNLSYVVLSSFARLNCPIKKVIVRYSYLPALASSLNDELDCANIGITERIMALGVSAEYCLYRGKMNEASIFEQKYKNSIESAKLPTKRMYVKSRKWV